MTPHTAASTANRETLTDQLTAAAELIDATGDPDGVGIGLLREHGLMSYAVPVEFGGSGATVAALIEVAGELGASCLGLAVLWVMHCQQVTIIAEYAAEPLRGTVLRAVADRQMLLGSITTEVRKGGHMLTAMSALSEHDGVIRFHREAPVVSGGAHADAYLVTMRRDEEVAADDVVLVYCPREMARPRVVAPMSMMGMRGTANVSLTLDVAVPSDHLIDPPGGFPRMASRCMAPLGHLGWAAAWVGAARAALRHVVGAMRGRHGGPALRRDDDVLDRLARVRCHLDIAESMLATGLREFEQRQGAELDSPAFQILANNVKIVAAEHTFAAVNDLVEIAGLGLGYRQGGGLMLERVFRDLRSASLMYSNQRLLRANGKLSLLDTAACSFRATGPLYRR